jgi:hypothetical protein
MALRGADMPRARKGEKRPAVAIGNAAELNDALPVR